MAEKEKGIEIIADPPLDLGEFSTKLKGQFPDVQRIVDDLLKSDPESKKRDGYLLMLCHQALFLDLHYVIEDYSFFDVAVDRLTFASRQFQETEEYSYLRNMKKLKDKSDRSLYRTIAEFDYDVQRAGFKLKDKRKVHRVIDIQIQHILDPTHHNDTAEETFETVCTELSSKGKPGKTTPYLLARTAGWTSIFLGVAVLVVAGMSVGATFGLGVPMLLPALWLSYTLIGAGLVAIIGGATAKNVALSSYTRACQDKEEWTEAYTSIKNTFWPPPSEQKPPQRSGIGMADVMGGIGAVVAVLMPRRL